MWEKTCWRAKCGEKVALEKFYLLIWYIHCIICCFFRIESSLKKLSSNYCFFGLYVCPQGKYCKHSVFLNIFRYPDYADPLCTAVLTIIFFHVYSNQKYGLFLSFVGLILWLKVYVAFNDLHNLKILLCECKLSFKIGSMYEIYWEKINLVSTPSAPLSGGQHLVPNFEKGSEKLSA